MGFKFVMETNANSGNLSVPEHMIQKYIHLVGHFPHSDFYLSWHVQLSSNQVTTLCCHGTQSDTEPVTMTSLWV